MMSRSGVRPFLQLVLALPAFLLCAVVVSAEEESAGDIAAMHAEIQELKKGQLQMRQQLAEIRALLLQQKSRSATRSGGDRDLGGKPIDTGDNPTMGAANTRVVMIEFSDYQCPYCARHAMQVLPKIRKDYVDTGKIQYTFVDFPLERIHKDAINAARAANCAGEQDKYWDMHSILFTNRKNLKPLASFASMLELETDIFNACLDRKESAIKVRNNLQLGTELGVSTTPSFIFAVRDDKTRQLKGIKLVRGALSYARFQKELNTLLN